MTLDLRTAGPGGQSRRVSTSLAEKRKKINHPFFFLSQDYFGGINLKNAFDRPLFEFVIDVLGLSYALSMNFYAGKGQLNFNIPFRSSF